MELNSGTMSEKTARIYNQGRHRGSSSNEAWESVRELAKEYSWDVERMLSDSGAAHGTVSDRELSQ